MLATCFPSIDNRMNRSLPKFGARCTINRAVFPLGVGAGVGRGLASAVAIATRRKTELKKILATVTEIVRWVSRLRKSDGSLGFLLSRAAGLRAC